MRPKQLICPRCGAEMNRHAAKVVAPRTADEAKSVDEALGGLIEHIHTCPECGQGAASKD